MRNYVSVLIGILLIAAPLARAADVSGQALLGNKGALRDAVVYLEGDRKAAPLAHAVVDQRERAFVPHVSVVTAGTTIQFPNNDTVFHNVFAYFQAKKFDLGMYPHGASKSVKFDKSGLVALSCNVHSEMSAYIMVVDTPYFAVTDKQGRFKIHNVAPGNYTLHAWHESGALLTQAVTIKESNDPITLSLARK